MSSSVVQLTEQQPKIYQEDSGTPGEDVEGDGSPQVLEGSAGAETEEETVNEMMEDLVPGEVLLKEADSLESVPIGSEAPSSMVNQTFKPNSEPPLDPVPTEPSLPSEESPSQH